MNGYAPEDEQGTPVGEAGGTGGIAFDGIRHCFERSAREGVICCYAARMAERA